MVLRFSTVAAAVALALGTSAASAASFEDMFTLRGYGTIGGVYSSQSEGDYVHDMYAQNEGVGATDSVSFATDSRTALQLDAKFTDRFSAVVQIVSEAVYNNTWDDEPNKLWTPSLEWANLSYRVTDDLTVRGGRIVMPLLMIGEYQKVGYANHWMRTPSEVYGKLPYTSVDGGDVSFKHSFGSATNTLRGFVGSNKVRREAPLANADIDMYGFVETVEVGALTLRASFANMKAQSVDTTQARADQLRMLSAMFSSVPQGAAAAATLSSLADSSTPGSKSESKYYALGASYDAGKWFAMGEVMKTEAAGFSPIHTSGYLSGGVRIAKWTPYASFALTDTKPFKGYLQTEGLPAQLAAVASGINASLQYVDDYAQDQSTASVGVRWDVLSHLAVKAQYDYVMLPSDSTGMFVNRTSSFEAGKDVSLFGLSVDFVF